MFTDLPDVKRNHISASEYESRVDALRELLASRGSDAALVWGRGGGTVDRCSDVRYLTGFYPVFPTIRDVPGVWRDRGLCAVLVTPDEVIVFSDDPGAVDASFGVTSSVSRFGVTDRDLAGDVLEALRARPGVRRLAQVASDAMSGHHARRLLSDDHYASLDVTWDDRLVEGLRLRKSEAEIALMRRAAQIAEEALEAGFAKVAPGVREADVVATMAEAVSRNEATLANAFVYTTPLRGEAEDNRLPVHSGRTFDNGDLFTIDLTGTFAGYFFDLARSVVVGGEPTAGQQRAYDLAKNTVDAVVERMVSGARLGDAARAGSELLRDAGIDPDEAEFAARGHGLGLGFESPWVRDDSELTLEPGMVISIEQFASLEGADATYERNILIGADGPEDLVAVKDFWFAALGKDMK